MAFMQRQVTEKQEWLEIDGTSGIEFMPIECADGAAVQIARDLDSDKEVSDEDLQAIVGSVYSYGEVYSATITTGYGARLSAPGYMDCTDWAVFDTEQEANDYLVEHYGEDEESDED